jgi:uncharacterized membrane protein YeaQ/YmgE (transglycosylase-associated protein family)
MDLSIVGFLLLLLLSAIVGVLAMAIVGFHPGGLLVAIGMGLVGGLLGMWIADVLDLPTIFAITVGGVEFPIVWALAGTVLLVAIVAAVSRAGYGRRRRFGY